MHPNTPTSFFPPRAASSPRNEESKENFFFFSPPLVVQEHDGGFPTTTKVGDKKRRRSSLSSSFGSNASSMKLTPRTGVCASALTRMKTSNPTPNTRKEVAKIHVLRKAKTDGKERVNGASGNAAFIRANTNKKKREKSALAEVIAKKDSAANEAIVEAIEEATFGELRACFPLVFDGRLSSSNNKEWLKAIMKRKLVTDKTYKFVPRTRYSSKNRLSKKKIQKTTKEIEKEEVTIAKSENVPLKESGNGTTIPPSPSAKIIEEEDDDEEPNVKKEVVFSVEVARREEQDEENGRVHEAIVTNAKTNVSEVEPKDEDVVRKVSSIFTNTFSAVPSPLGTGLQK